MDYKTCIRCGTTKPLTDFYVYGTNVFKRCKECQKQHLKEYRKHKPESKEKRRKRYIKESLDSGMRYRVGLKYVLDMPTETHAKCTKCGQWKTLEHYRKEDSHPTSRPNYYRTICKECGLRSRRKIRLPEEYPVPCPTCGKRFKDVNGVKNHHRKTHKIILPRSPRKIKPPRPLKERKSIEKKQNFLYQYLLGDGCCFYCGKIEPWELNRHHIWGRKNSDFTITLCENHHAILSRHVPFLLGEWY